MYSGNIKSSHDKPDPIVTKVTVDFGQGDKIPQIEVIRRVVEKEKGKRDDLRSRIPQ